MSSNFRPQYLIRKLGGVKHSPFSNKEIGFYLYRDVNDFKRYYIGDDFDDFYNNGTKPRGFILDKESIKILTKSLNSFIYPELDEKYREEEYKEKPNDKFMKDYVQQSHSESMEDTIKHVYEHRLEK